MQAPVSRFDTVSDWPCERSSILYTRRIETLNEAVKIIIEAQSARFSAESGLRHTW